jgi:hypothetical protein
MRQTGLKDRPKPASDALGVRASEAFGGMTLPIGNIYASVMVRRLLLGAARQRAQRASLRIVTTSMPLERATLCWPELIGASSR